MVCIVCLAGDFAAQASCKFAAAVDGATVMPSSLRPERSCGSPLGFPVEDLLEELASKLFEFGFLFRSWFLQLHESSPCGR